jgi:hypothetical protein
LSPVPIKEVSIRQRDSIIPSTLEEIKRQKASVTSKTNRKKKDSKMKVEVDDRKGFPNGTPGCITSSRGKRKQIDSKISNNPTTSKKLKSNHASSESDDTEEEYDEKKFENSVSNTDIGGLETDESKIDIDQDGLRGEKKRKGMEIVKTSTLKHKKEKTPSKKEMPQKPEIKAPPPVFADSLPPDSRSALFLYDLSLQEHPLFKMVERIKLHIVEDFKGIRTILAPRVMDIGHQSQYDIEPITWAYAYLKWIIETNEGMCKYGRENVNLYDASYILGITLDSKRVQNMSFARDFILEQAQKFLIDDRLLEWGDENYYSNFMGGIFRKEEKSWKLLGTIYS